MDANARSSESQLAHLLALAINLEPSLFDEVVQVATRDELTGAYNVAFQQNQLQNELKRARVLGYPLGALLFEVEPREPLQEEVQTMIADQLIRAVAKSISDSLRATDWLARSGTSSLTIVLPGCQPGHMEQIAHENLNRIASIQISSIDGLEIHPHAYVGGAAFVRGYPDSDAFLSKLADALDNAKALGPGHVVIQRINPWLRSQSVA